jgi:thymidine kinase
MWGGKTEALVSRLERARLQGVRVKAFTPAANRRDGEGLILTHTGARFPAVTVPDGAALLAGAGEVDVVGLDEFFMLPGALPAVVDLADRGVKVVVATLDRDSENRVWEGVGELLALAEEVVKCPAVCQVCKRDAYYTFRKPRAPVDRVLAGAEDFYEPRCRDCWLEGQRAKRDAVGEGSLFRRQG